VTAFTPDDGDAATTSWTRSRRLPTSFFPINPLPPMTTIFMVLSYDPIVGCPPTATDHFALYLRPAHGYNQSIRGPPGSYTMIPLRDNIPPRTFPFVNYLMIAACAVAFFAQLADQGEGDDQLVDVFGMIPARVMHPHEEITVPQPVRVQTPGGYRTVTAERTLPPLPFSPWLTLLTCTFLHGGWMHFLGNMWFLHIFGDNVEDRFGHGGYFLFYLGAGVAASVAHLASDPSSTMPTIGASGAIAGVMGAYMLLYPHAKVLAALPIFIFVQMFVVPAPLFLGIWFLMQFFEGAFSVTDGQAGGVAWWAHIGGFIVGAVVAWFMEKSGHCRPPVVERLPNTDRMSHYRYRRAPRDDW
jgi:membrane associated rhomboid family serine protease